MPEKPPYNLVFAAIAQKTLAKMDASNEAKLIEGLERFAETGLPRPKPLVGKFKGAYRLRFGDLRVIITIDGKAVNILDIAKRDKAYKR
jgi:mRNA-degrading endonuclease RelE of RelBE toxin-antitoxin system